VAPRKANGEPTPTAFADTEARWCVSFARARRSQLSDYAPEIDSCEQGNPAEDYRAPHPDTAETVGRKNIFMDVDHIPARVDFVAHPNSQIAACKIALVGDESGWPRLDTIRRN